MQEAQNTDKNLLTLEKNKQQDEHHATTDIPDVSSIEIIENADEKSLTSEQMSLMAKLIHKKLAEYQNSKIDISGSDIYKSTKSFEALNLNPDLLKGIYDMGFSKPSKIQETALPVILDQKRNLIAQSQNGTGKTATFLISVLSTIDLSKKFPQAIILIPVYELAIQVNEVLMRMSKYMSGLTVALAIRSSKVAKGILLSDQVVIGTPGTIKEWIWRYRVIDLKNILLYVLDEADVMIDMQGCKDESLRLNRELPPTCRRLFFSATYSEDVMNFANKIVTNPVVLALKREQLTLDTVDQYYVICSDAKKKYEAICIFYSFLTIGQSMIFCRTRKGATELAQNLIRDGHHVAFMTGKMTVEERADVISKFRDGQERILICTNVCSRGLDIDQVTFVLNYDVPVTQDFQPDYDTYLHRVGRTGRFGRRGLAVSFVDSDESLDVLKKIQTFYNHKIKELNAFDLTSMETLMKTHGDE